MKLLKNLKLAIVCDWLTVAGGAEKVILALHQLFPNAPIYTTMYNPEKVKGFEKAQIHTSYLQKITFARKHHQLFLTLYPQIFENFDLDQYDIVISSSHSCAKGIITKPSTLHISYCHSPMRYAWEYSQKYINEYSMSSFLKRFVPLFMHDIRIWDRLTADRVDHFVANSQYIAQRIQKYYRRDATVIYPFIKCAEFFSSPEKGDYYIAYGRLTSYKKFDLLVQAFNLNGKPLIICGSGPEFEKLKKMAKPNIQLLGFTPDTELKKYLSKAKALLFPQVEDFGIIPLEAMASGCPVIAYGKGGALETVKEGVSGLFFSSQDVASLNNTIEEFEKKTFNIEDIIAQANQFDIKKFNQQLTEYVEHQWQKHLTKHT